MICYRFKDGLNIVLFLLASVTIAWTRESNKSVRAETEQLLQHYRSLKNKTTTTAASVSSLHDGKCGFGIQAQVLDHWKEFTPVQQNELSMLIKAGAMQCEIIVGRFRVSFDTTGSNTPALLDYQGNAIPNSWQAYIDSVGKIFNHVWDIEIDTLKYSAPPYEIGQSYYNVYVRQFDTVYYGQTMQIWPPVNGDQSPALYRSYIEIDNDYQEFNTKGMNGLKVTAAHEFHHAIQIGSYGYWGNNLFAYEITSTWMEDVVYTDVNDYYNYLPTYFRQFSDGRSFNSNSYGGYERCIWAHFLAKRFGRDIMRDVWTAMQNKLFLESTDDALMNRGSNLQEAFAEFTYWNYFTADRANTEKYYPEGDHYPRFRPLETAAFNKSVATVGGDVSPLSSSMYEFDLSNDTVTAIIANVDFAGAINDNSLLQRVDVSLSINLHLPPYQELSNGLTTRISVATPSLWRHYFSKDIINSDSSNAKQISMDASPNPYRLNESNVLILPIQDNNAHIAQVYFYSASLYLACTGQFNITDVNGNRMVVIPTSDVKSKISSGVYFVIAKTARSDYKWKVAVIR